MLLSNDSTSYAPLIIMLIVAVAITIGIVVLARVITDNQVRYSKKPSLLTPLEKEYYSEFCQIFAGKYIVFPQINLASVVNKDTQGFRNELFRNIDFGVFTAELDLVLLIEINDRSHLRPDRVERDKSVKKICKKAHIPLVTFWTKDGINRQEFIAQFSKYVKL